MFKILSIQRKERTLKTCTWKEIRSKVRVYVSHEGESILDNLGNRFSRPTLLYKDDVLPAVQAFLGTQAKVRWSQKAGCSCGCSPGFIVDGVFGFDVFVTVTDGPRAQAELELEAQR